MKVELPDPSTAPELFEGVLTRRVIAYFIDLFLIALIMIAVVIVGLVSGFLSFGLGWLTIPIAAPLALVAYYALTLGSPRRATIGMSMMDIVLTPTRGLPLDGWTAFAHPLLFWVTWWAQPLLILVPLFTPRRQMLHDLLLGTLMLRRSPMERHWEDFQAA